MEALRSSEAESRRRGYTAEDVRLAIFAVVALLDETVLNHPSPVFASWRKKPVQEELFNMNVAGEFFFQTLQRILPRDDSPATADLLEVYALVLLIGFKGRYATGGAGELRSTIQALREKIQRIRGPLGPLAPRAFPSEQVAPAATDPWIKRLAYASTGCLLLALLLWGGFSLWLNSGVGEIRAMAVSTRR